MTDETYDPSSPGSFENRFILTQRYLREVIEEDMTIEEIEALPRWQWVFAWHLALEHYEGRKRTPFTIAEYKSIYGD